VTRRVGGRTRAPLSLRVLALALAALFAFPGSYLIWRNFTEGADPAVMLRHALDKGRVDKFEVGEMSLHDIFIAQVRAEGGDLDEEDAARSKA
jgi:hypothetical protein